MFHMKHPFWANYAPPLMLHMKHPYLSKITHAIYVSHETSFAEPLAHIYFTRTVFWGNYERDAYVSHETLDFYLSSNPTNMFCAKPIYIMPRIYKNRTLPHKSSKEASEPQLRFILLAEFTFPQCQNRDWLRCVSQSCGANRYKDLFLSSTNRPQMWSELLDRPSVPPPISLT